MKNTIARLAFAAMFALAVSAASAPVPASFEQASSATTVTIITVSGSAGINL